MDVYKSSLMKSILEKVGKCLSASDDDVVLTDLSDLMKKCHYLKIRTISNEYFTSEDTFMPDKVESLLEAFRSQLSDNNSNSNAPDQNSFLKRPHSAAAADNISLSSDDLEESDDSEPVIKCRRRDSHKYAIADSDSDIEIIDDRSAKENIDTSNQQTTHQQQQRYELRDRRKSDPPKPPPVSAQSQRPPPPPQPRFCRQTRSSATAPPAAAAVAEIIQIEDSTDDDGDEEDVQEIRVSAPSGSRNGHKQQQQSQRRPFSRPAPQQQQQQQQSTANSTRNRTDHPPTQADPSQLASIPLVVQFPTMQAATFNGHLYISHSHKFSVKLQGVDPRNFRWN